jgi:hypothetical protein
MQLCPKCGYAMDAHTGTAGNKEPPRPGDIGVCVGCMSPFIFDENLKLREPTDAEMDAIPKDIMVKIRFAKTVKKIMDETIFKPKQRTRQ